MSHEAKINFGNLGHLCDLEEFVEIPAVVLATQRAIQGLLPQKDIKLENQFNGEVEFTTNPPLDSDESELFKTQIETWAKQQGIDYCTCSLFSSFP